MTPTKKTFPYLVVRIMPAVYKHSALNITETGQIRTYRREIFENFQLNIYIPKTFSTEQKKSAISESVQHFSEKINFNVALVWSEDETNYFTSKGLDAILGFPPSGGLENLK